MKNFKPTESIQLPTESKYCEISNNVWVLFKKYFPVNVDLTNFASDVHQLTEKYGDSEYRDFMQKLLKVYFDELNRIKG